MGKFQKIREIAHTLKFVVKGNGKQYGIGMAGRFKLLLRAKRNNERIPSKTSWLLHVYLINQILGIPKGIKGDVVECGCLHGASTANLSIACKIANRRLFVCDSFEGLPEPKDDDDRYTVVGDTKTFYEWKKNYLASKGGVEGVMKNVMRYGEIGQCVFMKGYFEDTLPKMDVKDVVLVFEDADMYSSVRSVVKYLWLKMKPGCKMYSHEPFSMEIVGLFFDRAFWKSEMGESPPGFIGSGPDGVFDGITRTWVGYATKRSKENVIKEGKSIEMQEE